MDGGDWISLAGVIIAGGAAGWSVWSARKSGIAQREATVQAGKATNAAEAAAAAQAEAAAAAKRSADALERQTRLAVEMADAAEAVPWSISYRTGAKWELHNDSDRPKFRVQLGGSGVSTRRLPGVIDVIHGRSSFEFWGNTAMGSDNRVEVTWHSLESGDDEPLTWSGTLPARPPR